MEGVVQGHEQTTGYEARREFRHQPKPEREEESKSRTMDKNILRHKLQAIHERLSEGFQSLNLKLDDVLQTRQQAPLPRTSSAQEQSIVPLEAGDAAFKQPDAIIRRLQVQLKDREQQLEQQKLLSGNLGNQLAGNKLELARLRKMMIRAGHKEDAPMDDDVAERFLAIRNDIFQLVRNHFSQLAKDRSGLPQGASADLLELIIQAEVADILYQYFFSPQALLFGFGDEEDNNILKKIEEAALRQRCNPVKVIEWRTSTIRIIKSLNLASEDNYPARVARQNWDRVQSSMRHLSTSAESHRDCRDFEGVCCKAYELALWLRGAKVEYEWGQDPGGVASIADKPDESRISALSTTLIKRLENIFAVALDETDTQTAASTSDDAPAPASLTETSVQQFQLDVESTAVVRAAEEIMMLTRTMKEIWLFGGLDTLAQDHEKDQDSKNEAARQKMDENVRVVEEGFKRFLDKYETMLDMNGKD
ncbi:uncharacterized protein Z518_07347 [Rhinocladiella mackenziei CBS 650.93]|uniref:Uncharacterized protein n=1 Tax=Rhinocladiella mackenziei CBS 650.93 TaxID=1442369 RepID=A0A0D2ID83_9EURO|nr:uncharacterized protein Z518_07347 [Rhinocladiella mackenziei CBS 650.93]KIX03794.1 hypothetical protein Z518_07347 [Rhinocladiella mackenziei CBS 650.93]